MVFLHLFCYFSFFHFHSQTGNKSVVCILFGSCVFGGCINSVIIIFFLKRMSEPIKLVFNFLLFQNCFLLLQQKNFKRISFADVFCVIFLCSTSVAQLF